MPLVRQAPCDKGRAGGAAPRVSAVESSKGIRSGARATFQAPLQSAMRGSRPATA
jgi:hypothetical protein